MGELARSLVEVGDAESLHARSLVVVTEMGSFEIALDDVAGETCSYFIAAIEAGVFNGGSVFRIVSSEQTNSAAACPIDVVQIGTQRGLGESRHTITHEHSGLTNLLHRKWVVSAARYGPGELYHSFFVCLKDEPELDHGGSRQPDRQGFAAFGHVISGYGVLSSIFDRAEPTDELAKPIRVKSIEIKQTPRVHQCTTPGDT